MPRTALGPGEERILLEALQLTRNGANAWAYEIATASRTTVSMAKSILAKTLEREFGDDVSLRPDERFRLALIAASKAGLTEVVRTLDWREFERFAEECLSRAGYQTERNVRLSDMKKRWEIDVVATKLPMMLFVDCKHWRHNSPQRLHAAIQHQKDALSSLTKARAQRLDAPKEVWSLPVILTLFDNAESVTDGGVLVSVQKFSDFLEHLTPYDSEIPFVPSTMGQKPIKEA